MKRPQKRPAYLDPPAHLSPSTPVPEPEPVRDPAPPAGEELVVYQVIDKEKYPDKYQQYRACEVQHRGMGTMEDDCKNAIPRPWR